MSGAAGLSLLSGCKGEEEGDEGQKVSPPEDLMQEHGFICTYFYVESERRAKAGRRKMISIYRPETGTERILKFIIFSKSGNQ